MRLLTSLPCLIALLAVALVSPSGFADDVPSADRVFPETVPDARLKPLRSLRDKDHPWQPPASIDEWQTEKAAIQMRLQVATGLWPMPEKTPLKPVIHSPVRRDGYVVERVWFASRPGLYVTGSLYKPATITRGQHPGVLCPHGHWANGRFYDAGEAAARKQIEQGAESRMEAARSPLQARIVQLARMGCVVFHYDMIGYADQGPLDHQDGFSDAQAELRSQNLMGLQTWNSIRALDFLLSLPEVDHERIAVTGASGGGTQTFMLCALDPRPHVAFPAVMVSTNMQGGCVCENASHLRIGINNVAIAACTAPRPLAMTGADDWTIDIERRGLPELKQVYSLYEAQDYVAAECFAQFGHNYNEVARKMMYSWLNEHLKLGAQEPIEEQDFERLGRDELTVFTSEHPRPQDALSAELLRQRLTAESDEWYESLVQQGQQSPQAYRDMVSPAVKVLLDTDWPRPGDIESTVSTQREINGATVTLGWCGRKGSGERIPWIELKPAGESRGLLVWIDGRGKHTLVNSKAEPGAAATRLLEQGWTIVSGDPLGTGETASAVNAESRPVDTTFAGYTFGYNRPLLAKRARDIVTLSAFALGRSGHNSLQHLATGEAGPWGLLASSVATPDHLDRIIVDVNGFAFSAIDSVEDEGMLPGALKFGGLGGLSAAGPDIPTLIFGADEQARQELLPLTKLHRQVRIESESISPKQVPEILAP